MSFKNNKLPHTSATYSKHGYTAVGQFILTVSLQGASFGMAAKPRGSKSRPSGARAPGIVITTKARTNDYFEAGEGANAAAEPKRVMKAAAGNFILNDETRERT